MQIVTDKIKKSALEEMARRYFGELVKVVVDVEKEIMAAGGEMHADEEALLLENGSRQEDLWGINLYPGNAEESFIEFDSVINIRPSQGNRSRGVDNPELREKITRIVRRRVE